MKIICANCQTQFRIKKNGVLAVDMFDRPERPYEAYTGDLWECPGCGARIVAGFGELPVAAHYNADRMNMALYAAERTGTRVNNYEKPRVSHSYAESGKLSQAEAK